MPENDSRSSSSLLHDTLLEFDRFVNPNPNPNPNPIQTQPQNPSTPTIDSSSTLSSQPLSTFNIDCSNPNPNGSSNFLTLTIPRKRRRGRPRSTTSSVPSHQQVFSIPQIHPSSIDSTSTRSIFTAHFAKSGLGFQDLSEEIIVINREATSEALTALTAGFPADSLTDEEIDAGVVHTIGGIEQVNYILIRNHIITKWRENVTNWVAKEMLFDVIPRHCHYLLDSAYDFLVSHGYVNFGVAPAIKERIPGEPIKGDVIIIGAGLAGLAAARQLLRFGFRVTVLEGRKRAGGRVYTKKMEGLSRIANADLGGSVLTGTLGNPLGILARQLSYSLHKVRDKCPLYRVDGSPVDPVLDSKVETAFNKLLDKASRLRQMMGEISQDLSLGAALDTFDELYGDPVTDEEMRLFNWHLANLEYANAGLLSKLSLAFWDQDDPYDMGGDHCFLSGGNGRLVQALVENVPIIYEKTVTSICYGSGGVQVTAGNQVFEGEMALCTVPLGVLKSGSIKFVPELPQRKLDGIKRLGFGLLNKVAMLFPNVFWGTDLDTFGHLSEDSARRGEFFLFYSYATVAGGALLIALVAGEAAHKFETMPPTDAVTRVLQILRGIYEPQGITVPEPIQTICTRWGSDPFCLGSYSNVAVGASGDDYDILAESVGDGRLFFAGEATMRRYPATMHGAFLSGLREAANMAHYATSRALEMKIERSASKNAHTYASLLADLFREPDLEFGSFSVIFEKKDNVDPKSTAILRVTFDEPQKKGHEGLKGDVQHSKLFQQLQSHFNEQQQVHVYTVLTRQQALELREVRGGDDNRLYHLTEKLGVKLVGRKGLGPAVDAAIASIKAERGNRKANSPSIAAKSGMLRPKGSPIKRKMIRSAKVIRNSLGSLPSNVLGNSNGPLSHSRGEPGNGLGSPAKVISSENPSVSSLGTCSPNISTSSEVVGNNSAPVPSMNTNVDAQMNTEAALPSLNPFILWSGDRLESTEHP